MRNRLSIGERNPIEWMDKKHGEARIICNKNNKNMHPQTIRLLQTIRNFGWVEWTHTVNCGWPQTKYAWHDRLEKNIALSHNVCWLHHKQSSSSNALCESFISPTRQPQFSDKTRYWNCIERKIPKWSWAVAKRSLSHSGLAQRQTGWHVQCATCQSFVVRSSSR